MWTGHSKEFYSYSVNIWGLRREYLQAEGDSVAGAGPVWGPHHAYPAVDTGCQLELPLESWLT